RNSSTRSSLSLASGSQASVGSTWSTPSSLTWRSCEAQTLEEASTMGVPSEVVLPNESMLAPIGQFSAVNIVVPSWFIGSADDPIGKMRIGEGAPPWGSRREDARAAARPKRTALRPRAGANYAGPAAPGSPQHSSVV